MKRLVPTKEFISQGKKVSFSILRKIKIQTRLIISFVSIILILLVFSCTYSYRSSSKAINDNVSNYSLQVLGQTAEILNSQVSQFEKLVSDFSLDTNIQRSLAGFSSSDELDRINLLREIDQYTISKLTSYKNIISFSIYNSDNFEKITSVGNIDSSKIITDNKKIYENTLKEKKSAWSMMTVNNKQYLAVNRPIVSINSGEAQGIVTLVPQENFLQSGFKDLNIGIDKNTKKPFAIFAVDSTGVVLSNRSDDYPLLKSTDITKQITSEIKNLKKASGKFDININGVKNLITFASFGSNGWYIVSAIPYSYLNSTANSLRNSLIIFGLICLLLSILISFIMANSISSPLKKLINYMKKAKEGDLTIIVKDNGKDELSEVSSNFNDMLININSLVSKVKDSSHEILDFSEKIATLASSSKQMSEHVSITVKQIADGAHEQANDINDSVGNMNKLSEEINSVGEDMNNVATAVNNAKALNYNASQAVEKLNEKSNQTNIASDKIAQNVNALNDSMKEIQKIVKVIVGISEQTNLLALNAAIEAARAGEAGKGFAVVSAEVKKLAEHTKEASASISSILSSIQKRTEITVSEANNASSIVDEQLKTVEDAEYTFKSIFELMDKIVSSMGKMDTSVSKIMRSKEMVLNAMTNVSAVSEESAATSQEIFENTAKQMVSSNDLAQYAGTLQSMSDGLNKAITKFKI